MPIIQHLGELPGHIDDRSDHFIVVGGMPEGVLVEVREGFDLMESVQTVGAVSPDKVNRRFAHFCIQGHFTLSEILDTGGLYSFPLFNISIPVYIDQTGWRALRPYGYLPDLGSTLFLSVNFRYVSDVPLELGNKGVLKYHVERVGLC